MATKNAVKFVDELPPTAPDTRGRASEWPNKLQPLTERPGTWAQIDGPHARTETKQGTFTSKASNLVSRLRKGPGGLNPDDWEFKTVRPANDPENVFVFGKYIAGTDEQANILAKRAEKAARKAAKNGETETE